MSEQTCADTTDRFDREENVILLAANPFKSGRYDATLNLCNPLSARLESKIFRTRQNDPLSSGTRTRLYFTSRGSF